MLHISVGASARCCWCRPAAQPDCTGPAAFRFQGHQAVVLHRGTWHAGPLFTAATADFVNLELADTNEAAHTTAALDQTYVLAGGS